MNALLAAACGAAAGIGLLLVVLGLRGVEAVPRRHSGSSGQVPGRSIAIGAAVGIVVLAATRWPVFAFVAGILGSRVPTWMAARGGARREIERAEAIATWTEQLRDTLSAASGLQQAIVTGAPLAPPLLRPAVARLAARLAYEPAPRALRDFADDVDHPLADFVVAALVTAATSEARELGPLLGHLADCAREEARMLTRVWVGRARTRTAVRIIAGVVGLSVLAIHMIDRAYLEPYSSADGQLVLVVVLAMFGAALAVMERLGRIAVPARFVGRRLGDV